MTDDIDADADSLILSVFKKNAGGSAWLSRKWLVAELVESGLIPPRKLDHRLKSLVGYGILVRKGDHNVGSVYALKENADKDKFLSDFAVTTRKRGATTVTLRVPVVRVNEKKKGV